MRTDPSFFARAREIAGAVEKRRVDGDPARFREIATGALEEAGAHRDFGPWTGVRELFAGGDLPPQIDPGSTFSDLPLTLYRSETFHVDLLHWLDGTTLIHEHSFSGAFQVLAGSSLHVRYRFRPTRAINERLMFGELTAEHAELLGVGDVREIRAGDEGIHSLFHLEAPSVTLVVRTHHDAGSGPQLEYVRPNLACDGLGSLPAATARRIQSLELLYRAAHPEADSIVAESLPGLDLEGTFHILRAAYPHVSGDDTPSGTGRFERLLDVARRQHGDDVDRFRPAFEEEERQLLLKLRRGMVRGAEHRFFLALLLNAPGRRAAMELVRVRHPGEDPAARIAGWLDELCRMPNPDRPSENILGLEGLDDGVLFVFRGLLDGLGAAEIASSSARPPGFDADAVEQIAEELKESVLFRTVLE